MVQPKEGMEAETFEEMQKVMDWQTKSAKKMGVSLAEFTEAAVHSQVRNAAFSGSNFSM